MLDKGRQGGALHHVPSEGGLVSAGTLERVQAGRVAHAGDGLSLFGGRQRGQGEPGGADASQVLRSTQQQHGIDAVRRGKHGAEHEGPTHADAHRANVVRIPRRTFRVAERFQQDMKTLEIPIAVGRMDQERDFGGNDEEASLPKGIDGLHDPTVHDASLGDPVHEQQLGVLRVACRPDPIESEARRILDEAHALGDRTLLRRFPLEGLERTDRAETRQHEHGCQHRHEQQQDQGPPKHPSSPGAHDREGTVARGRRSTRYNAAMRTRHPALLLSGAALLLLAFGWTLLGDQTRDSTAETPEIEFHKDVVYGTVDGLELTLNLARPKGLKKPTATVALFHGGGWMRGNKTQLDRVARWLAEKGFIAATVGYRLAPRHKWPAHIEDAKCSIRYLRSTAEKWSIDPERIGAVGFSAGAHLAMLLGTMDPADGLEGSGGHEGHASKVNAVVSFFGPTDLDPDTDDPRLKAFKRAIGAIMGPRFKEDPDAASPVTYVDKRDVPMLLFQGTRDPLVPHGQALTMLERLNTAGISAEVVFLVGRAHGWQDPDFTDTVDRTLRFLDRQFRPTRIPSKWDAILSSRK